MLIRCVLTSIVASLVSVSSALADELPIPRDRLQHAREIVHGGGPGTAILTLSVAPDSRTLITGGADRTIRVWELATGKEVRRILGHASYVHALAYSPNGKCLASLGSCLGVSREQSFRLWDPITGTKLRELRSGKTYVCDIVFAPDGERIFSAHDDYTIHAWKLKTGKEAGRFQGRVPVAGEAFKSLYSIGVSPNGQFLVGAGTDNRVHVWETESGKIRRCMAHDDTGVVSDWIRFVAFLADGKTVVSVSYSQIRLWDTVTGKELHRLSQPSEVTAVAVSPDGKSLVSADRDSIIRLWETATGQERDRFAGQRGKIKSLAFAPNGRLFVSGSTEGAVLSWDLTAKKSRLSLEEMAKLWADMGNMNAAEAYCAQRSLLGEAPAEAIPFIEKRLLPVLPVEKQRLAQLIDELDSDRHAVREQAERALEKLGESAGPALHKVLANNPTLEVRHRAERLVEKLDRFAESPMWLRQNRALELLEQIGTQEARLLLTALAAGDPEARLTREASLACKRLAKNLAVMP